MQITNRRQTDQISSYRSDIVTYRERIEEVTKIRDVSNEKVLQLEQRCRELEDRSYRTQHQQQETLIERDDEIQQLKQQIEHMQNDFQILVDTKIGLDREIATYRKLLDSEEERLNIVGRLGPSPTIPGSATPTIIDGLPVVNSLPVAGRHRMKRPRFEVEDDAVLTNGNGH